MELKVPLIDIILSISSAIDLIDPIITNHHKRVAYISYSIAKEMDLPDKQIKDLVFASLLHDCGSVNLSERKSRFEFGFRCSILQNQAHGNKGWVILRDSTDLHDAAEIIRFHHVYWKESSNAHLKSYEIPITSHILHLADRVDILINRKNDILTQRRYIENTINENSGTMFMPEVVEAFNNLVPKQFFWFDIISPYLDDIIKKVIMPFNVYVDDRGLYQYAEIIHRIIDFRSRYTATHSIGVATCASILASKLGFSDSDTQMIHAAGLIHDMGMLSVSEDILEKPGTLDLNEYNTIKYHTYLTYRLLDSIPGLEKIRDWASFHHEKLDGTGYPFGLESEQLDLGSRILAVSDLFISLIEERSYRDALSIYTTMEIINNAKNLDSDVKTCLRKNLDEIVQKINISKDEVYKNNKDILNFL
ncbi:HD domain-containing protein [Ruminiclostridium herbifermentans]|uniref:HD domain-containing protein n=1 Tax=Ruminiclostridium herbifermentans TaxID=2488810 RepID=A0A4U7JKB7_9FIRM|nr:HD domain-containing phosphohydrolase [Ruminiclostridium herbifermentans]QNU66707.1 HD domain-containing protein [Ruminiclostridium herbifermentans]